MGVVGGGSMQPGQVGADQPDLEGSTALDTGEHQVAAGRHLPRHVDHAGEVAAPAAGLRFDAPLEVAAQRQGFERGVRPATTVRAVAGSRGSSRVRTQSSSGASRS